MTVEQLKARLSEEGFNVDGYWIGDDEGWRSRSDCYCLQRNRAVWKAFYTERGLQSQVDVCPDENVACERFYKMLYSCPYSREHLLVFLERSELSATLESALTHAGIAFRTDRIPCHAGPNGLCYRIFVDGRDLSRALKLRDGGVSTQ